MLNVISPLSLRSTISTFVVESWADAVLAALSETADRMDRHERSIKTSALSSRLDSVSKDSLLEKVAQLEKAAAAAKRREVEHMNTIRELRKPRTYFKLSHF